MNLKNIIVINTVVNSKSPFIIFVNNITEGVLVILRKFYVGSITKAADNRYLISFKGTIAKLAAIV